MIGVPSFCSRVVPSAVVSTLVAGTVVLIGCGGAAPEAAAPSSPAAKSPDEARTTSEPASIDEAQAQIAAARAQLGGAGGGDSSSSRFAPAPGAAPAPGTSPPPATSPAAPPTADSATRPSTQDRCGGPCRALSSMRRAVTALCRMTGNDDARCADAKRTLVESEGRVAPCSC